MNAEGLKLSLIGRLMKVQNPSTLERIEELIIQAEMESRTNESLVAIEKGEVISLHEFGVENEQWAKKKYIK